MKCHRRQRGGNDSYQRVIKESQINLLIHVCFIIFLVSHIHKFANFARLSVKFSRQFTFGLNY